MADKAISDLTQALQITNEDLFVLEQGGTAKKLKGATLLDFVTLSVVSVTVTTLPAGSSATATYDKSTGTLALGIPQGNKGDTGATGATGATGPQGEQGVQGETGATGTTGPQGPAGPANVLTIGSVTSGKVASATITGEAPNQVLNLVLEKGDKGDTGLQGPIGPQGPKGDKGDTGPAGPVNVPATTSLIKGDGSGGLVAAVKGTDYATPSVSFTVTLSASGWINKTQTVSDARFLTNGYAYSVAPDSGSFAAYGKAVIYADNVTTAGQMQFHCSETPTVDLTVNILRMEVSA